MALNVFKLINQIVSVLNTLYFCLCLRYVICNPENVLNLASNGHSEKTKRISEQFSIITRELKRGK